MVAAGKPAGDGLVVRVRYQGVAEDAVSHSLLQGLDDGRSSLEVHIGYPHRDNIFLLYQVPFVGIGAPAVDDFIKIVFHISFSIFFVSQVLLKNEDMGVSLFFYGPS